MADDEVRKFLGIITDARDRTLFMVMLRCGLRAEEVAHLTVDVAGLQDPGSSSLPDLV
jgi:integrase